MEHKCECVWYIRTFCIIRNVNAAITWNFPSIFRFYCFLLKFISFPYSTMLAHSTLQHILPLEFPFSCVLLRSRYIRWYSNHALTWMHPENRRISIATTKPFWNMLTLISSLDVFACQKHARIIAFMLSSVSRKTQGLNFNFCRFAHDDDSDQCEYHDN